MKKLLSVSVILAAVACVLATESDAGRKSRNPPFPTQDPIIGASLSAAAVDTFDLGWFSFDAGGVGSAQGWISVDLTAQLSQFWHVASSAGELNGGNHGNLLPLEGSKSMWCGVAPTTAIPFCGWAELPGYGNDWDQILTTSTLPGDSVRIAYKVFWDSEPGYDGTVVEYSGDGGVTWTAFPVGAGLTERANIYDLGPTTLVESFAAGGLSAVLVRFRFQSDGARSDEDGLWPTDGAILVDSVTVTTWASGIQASTNLETFESAADGSTTAGIWSATAPAPFGDFAALYPGVSVLQEDACFTAFSFFWAWFDNPASTNYNCHIPNPLPSVGALPFGNAAGLYLSNEIWSPAIANIGAGAEYRLGFRVYKDLPHDNLQFFTWKVRTIDGTGCPTAWRDREYVYYGGHKFWLPFEEPVGDLIDAGAPNIQIAVGVVDLCGIWCGVLGSGACHSHAPLIDEIHLKRINVLGPQWGIRHIDLFQDNFAEDGTLTGTARADRAEDIAPATSPTVLPGDSVSMTVRPVGTDGLTGVGPAAYLYAAVWPQGQTGKAGVNIEAQETRAGVGKRWPLVASPVLGGAQWYQFRMDSVVTVAGGVGPAGLVCVDLNDNVFSPGDTICYFFGADDGLGNATYCHRLFDGQGQNNVTTDINQAASSPMEFTILPAGGVARGGDILYVDDADDRGGPTQLFFDTALDYLQIRDEVDRYDILDSSTFGGNGLATRVKNVATQIIGPYRKIIWNSGNRESGLMGDGGTVGGGGGQNKSPDFSLIFQFLDTHTNNPGVYYSGDDVASDWALTLIGASAVNTRSVYMNFNLDPAAPNGDHKNAGEPASPLVSGAPGGSGSFNMSGFKPDSLVVYGGCPIFNDFDLLQATGLSVAEMENAATGKTYVLSQTTANSAGSTARFLLSGFSYHFIRDPGTPGSILARVTHLEHVLEFLQNIVPTPTGFEPQLYANVLRPNYPNPFNPTTTIGYEIKDRGHVTLKIYNAAGQLVRTLVNQVQVPQAGGFSVTWDGTNNAGQAVSSGVYFYKLAARNFTMTRKLVLLK
ncbi:MAG: FlgD immunoglobulin-like domain containing protein [Candidatus Krumholzibacteriia bacterium]